MPTCSFCKKSYSLHKGVIIFTLDGKAIHYCSSKCRKNANLGRDSKKVLWIKKRKK
ncbi:50S ribosomal protein L24e [Candidatus Pacearchaeota archaeon]|nr:50S ribosomal protein L24e [Candidatus Pacearchaeota archaeon]